MTKYTETWTVETCIHGNWIKETRIYHCPKYIIDSDLENIPGKRRNAQMIKCEEPVDPIIIDAETDLSPYQHLMSRHTDIY